MQCQTENLSLPENLNGVHIHFVGIKGTGMAALVEILYHKGAVITGSDVSEKFYTDEVLQKIGIVPKLFSSENITDDIQYVIYSSAYKLDKNPDLIQAIKKDIPCLLYTQALGSYSSRSYSCGICGVHGKTSTAGLVGTILKEIDLPSQVLAGSVINSFGGTCTYTSPLISAENSFGKSERGNENGGLKNETPSKPIFVAETCEYQRHFMSFCPQKIILTSVESDHEDYYPTYEDIRKAFVEYICKLPQGGELVYCADDKGACDTVGIVREMRSDIKLIPYGENAKSDFSVKFGEVKNEKNSFYLKLFEDKGEFSLSMPGKHEVLDAAAAVALVCRLLATYGKNPADYYNQIKNGLIKFTGGKRRSEKVGEFKNHNGDDVIVIDDYGHHPTAVRETLEGFKSFYSGRKLIVDFMSHTYSRTQALLNEFSQSFSSADELILHKIYSSARENPSDFEITGRTLFESVLNNGQKNVFYFEEVLDAEDFAKSELEKPLEKEFPNGYLFVTMGAGDNWKLGRKILEKF